ncbi:SPOR domain-containing protein [Acidovorax sp.]|uniref:SPOR domain-containing protein n=1 Tax=Acidovorax sp. TaxID=1872122 RepID=UPI0025C34174|nr:SPOR domain-containing protein [Acidovorax sp.]MCI5068617.1 SPOR domain-containing protein [Acidovorax sp.]
MLDHTDPVASIIPAASLDSPSDNAMRALTRLALGPVNTDYYLAVFDRFDNTGRTTTSWNWAACLSTLNWMVFRQLWSASLVYLAAAEGLALVVYALGRSLLHWPLGIELGVLGAFAMLAFVVPGLYGNALLYADIRKRVGRALAASRTLPEACASLQKQASTRKRLHAVVWANGALLAAAVLAYLLWPSSPSPDARPLALEPAVTVAQATAAAASAAASGRVSVAPEPEAGTDVATGAQPSASQAAPAAPTTPAPALTPAPSTPALSTPAPAPIAAPSPPATAPASAPVVAAATAAPADKSPAPSTKKPTSTSTPAAEPASRAASSAKAKPKPAKSPAVAASAATAAASASSAPLPLVGTAPGYYINVGLFADEANARKAQARLLNEGLPAFRQELQSAKGRRIRVRVGPYNNRAGADAAATSIRAMGLEAIVFKQ